MKTRFSIVLLSLTSAVSCVHDTSASQSDAGRAADAAPSDAQLPRLEAGRLDQSEPDISEAGCPGPACQITCSDVRLVAETGGPACSNAFELASSADGKTIVASWTAGTCADLFIGDHVLIAVSVDGGKTFGPPRPAGPGLVRQVQLRIAANGDIYAAFFLVNEHVLRIGRSTDHGATFAKWSELPLDTNAVALGLAFAISADAQTLALAWNGGSSTAVSRDAGHSWHAIVGIPGTPDPLALRPETFVLADGRLGIVYAQVVAGSEPRTVVTKPALVLSDDKGEWQAPVMVASDDYAGSPVTSGVYQHVGMDMTPRAALGDDGSIHVVWWSTQRPGKLWHAVSTDAKTFSAPVSVFSPPQPTPADAELTLDHSGTLWIAVLDAGGWMRVLRVPRGGVASEVLPAAAITSMPFQNTYAITSLPRAGAVVFWRGGPAVDEPRDASVSTDTQDQLFLRTLTP